MSNYLNIKKQLLKACILFVENKHTTISKSIASNKNDLFSETKSSAGDKHETGRAMIQLEMEKAGQQLAEVSFMQTVLSKIVVTKVSNIVCLGSLVKTTKGNYFLAVSVGQIKVENHTYFAVSAQSPIGKQLLGKKVGAIIEFNKAEVLEVV
ncbi:3-oxoacyl-ACP synthase [Lutibacter holmesii]|uniref:3-oxoacyl-ACP synthase n=1 Tax=Lutibacter holmesii TaxID=1137985 RepID=A0ABW3WMM1_9FLAO